MILNRDKSNEIYNNLMPAQIGNDLERNNTRLILNSQENEDLGNLRYFYNNLGAAAGGNSTSNINFRAQGRSTSLISPANMSMASNDQALIINEGRKVSQH